MDPSSGAAMATLDALRSLTRADFHCRAFCASKVDAGNWKEEVSGKRWSVSGGRVVRKQRLAISSERSVELTHCTVGALPIQIFETESSRIDEWLPGEPEAMLAAFERIVSDFRPDVLLTYGGDPVTRAMRHVCRVAGDECRGKRPTPVVFWLHNFAYDDARCFEDVDRVIVPSEFSKQWYRERLGLQCRVLPYLIDWRRVCDRKEVIGDRLSVIGESGEEVSGRRWAVSGEDADAQHFQR
jgi:hypothetical protein